MRSSNRVWVCDPIDGTLPFTLGVPTSLFSLALVVDGEPVVGVLYDPYLDRRFEACVGQGGAVNGVPLAVSDAPLSGAVLAAGDQFGLTDNAALASDVIRQGGVLPVGSITYEAALVAGPTHHLRVPGTVRLGHSGREGNRGGRGTSRHRREPSKIRPARQRRTDQATADHTENWSISSDVTCLPRVIASASSSLPTKRT